MPSLENRGTSRRTRRPGAPPSDGGALRSTQYRRLINPFQPLRVFSDDHVAHIHRSALNILETSGIKILLPVARNHFAAAGAIVSEDEELVRIGTDIVERALTTTRPRVDLHALSTDHDVTIGDAHCAIGPVSGPPNVTDSIRGRRAGSLQDFSDFVRLSQTFDVIHLLGPSVEPQDIPTNFRHLEVTRAQLTLSNKIPFVYSRGSPQVADCFSMIRIAHGINEAEFGHRVYCYTNINTNSPRQIDVPMAQGIIDFASAGQLSIITPFTLAGAMAPITVPGALTLAHAEALAGITLAQLVRPEAPVAYGSFTSNVDMRSGSPAFGTPEYVKACFGAGQLARHIGLPWRSSGATAANVPDEQATYETAMSLWGALLGGCNILLHGAGWLESGLSASFEKFIIDIEMLQILAEILQPVTTTDAEIGLEAIAEVPPGGHFFSVPHTMARYRTAFYSPLLSDWRNFGQWQEDGAKIASQRASEIWQRLLQEYKQPTLDSAIAETLDAYVEERRSEGGASPVA